MTAASEPGADAEFDRGLDLLAEGRPSDAIAHLQQALALDPAHHEAIHALMRAFEDTDRFAEAIALAQQAIARDPADILAHTRLSILFQRTGRIPEAEAVATRARLLDWKRQLREPEPAGLETADAPSGINWKQP